MRFLVISDCGNALGIALRIQAEGNEVRMWTKDPRASSVGRHMIEPLDRKFKTDFDTVHVFDTTNFGAWADALRMGGYPVVGGSLVADDMESDRAFARQVMKEAGIESPPGKFFNNWDAMKEHVRSNKGKRLVLKPCESLSGNLPSHCADKDFPTEEMLGVIEHYERTYAGDIEVEMQDFWPGVDISSAVWFDGENIIGPAIHTLEVKATQDGDRGATAGCAGNLLWGSDDWIIEGTIMKMVPVLRKYEYVGIMDVNALVRSDTREIKGLELTPRMGWDSEPTVFSALMNQDLGKTLADIALGQADVFPLKDGFAGGVRIGIPPYPSDKERAPAGLPVLGVSDKDLTDWLFAYDLMKSEDGKLLTSGNYGMIGVACAHDATASTAMKKATERARQVHVSESSFRLDLTEVFDKYLKELGLLSDISESSKDKKPAERKEAGKRPLFLATKEK